MSVCSLCQQSIRRLQNVPPKGNILRFRSLKAAALNVLESSKDRALIRIVETGERDMGNRRKCPRKGYRQNKICEDCTAEMRVLRKVQLE